MKLYTFFTDSHLKLLELFLKQYPYSENVELNIKWFPQECKNASYMSEGWTTTMKRKVEYVLQALNETPENEWFVHSDCDIALFRGWSDVLRSVSDDMDMLVQTDYSMLCAGFFFCKSNSRTKELWTNVLNNLDKFDHDQTAMNFYIHRVQNLKIGVLPSTYFTYGFFNQQVWTGVEEFTIPAVRYLRMFHANWTEGVENKLKLMQKAIDQYNNYFIENTNINPYATT